MAEQLYVNFDSFKVCCHNYITNQCQDCDTYICNECLTKYHCLHKTVFLKTCIENYTMKNQNPLLCNCPYCGQNKTKKHSTISGSHICKRIRQYTKVRTLLQLASKMAPKLLKDEALESGVQLINSFSSRLTEIGQEIESKLNQNDQKFDGKLEPPCDKIDFSQIFKYLEELELMYKEASQAFYIPDAAEIQKDLSKEDSKLKSEQIKEASSSRSESRSEKKEEEKKEKKKEKKKKKVRKGKK